MFRASDYIAAKQPWQFESEGRVYTARLVSKDQVLAYNASVVDSKRAFALSKDPAIATAIQARIIARAFRRLLRIAFPWRPSMLVTGDPVRRFFALPPDVFDEAAADFFASLARSRPSPTPAPATAEPVSSPS